MILSHLLSLQTILQNSELSAHSYIEHMSLCYSVLIQPETKLTCPP